MAKAGPSGPDLRLASAQELHPDVQRTREACRRAAVPCQQVVVPAPQHLRVKHTTVPSSRLFKVIVKVLWLV